MIQANFNHFLITREGQEVATLVLLFGNTRMLVYSVLLTVLTGTIVVISPVHPIWLAGFTGFFVAMTVVSILLHNAARILDEEMDSLYVYYPSRKSRT